MPGVGTDASGIMAKGSLVCPKLSGEVALSCNDVLLALCCAKSSFFSIYMSFFSPNIIFFNT